MRFRSDASAGVLLSLSSFLLTGVVGCNGIRPRHEAAMTLGVFDVPDRHREFEGGLEYRSIDLGLGVRPIAGMSATTAGSVYGYAGSRWEVPAIDPVLLAPSLAASVYEPGAGKDLGHAVEFRSGIDLGYRLDNGLTFAIGIDHLSNAALSDHNPDANSVIVSYSYEF
jgi:hypothetical protein